MAVGDDLIEGPVSSLFSEALEFNQSEDALSPEDLAWVDSCLVKDPDTSDINWNSLRDALLDILASHPEPLDSSAVGNDGFPGGTDMEIIPSSEEVGGTDIEILPSIEEVEAAQLLGIIDDDHHVPFNEVAINEEIGILMSQVLREDLSEPFIGDALLSKSKDGQGESEAIDSGLNLVSSAYEVDGTLMSQVLQEDVSKPFIGDALLSKSKDGQRESEAIDSGLNLVSSAYEVEPSTKDIFRVWDLDIPAEEDELVNQLNEALEESSFKDFKDESIDNLIAGVAELSLNHSA